MSLDRHSSLTDRTKRSANAFKFGLRGGSRRHFTPPAARVSRNSAQNFGIAIRQNVATVVQRSQLLQRRIARNLAHPARIRMIGDSRYGHSAAAQVNEKSDNSTSPGLASRPRFRVSPGRPSSGTTSGGVPSRTVGPRRSIWAAGVFVSVRRPVNQRARTSRAASLRLRTKTRIPKRKEWMIWSTDPSFKTPSRSLAEPTVRNRKLPISNYHGL
jgi:hypothetical protein